MNNFLKQIQDDSEDLKPMGGTELMLSGLKDNTTYNAFDNLNIILSTPDINKIRYTKKNILWQHLSYLDESLLAMKDHSFMGSLDAQVYISHWQYEKFRYLFQIPTHNAYIIKNAIKPIEYIKRSKDEKIKLIYASMPFRGLDVLLDAFELLDRDDVELEVYSSTKLYGSGFANYVGAQYDWLFAKAKNMKNVKYVGLASNEEVRKAMQSANILAYPSTFEETSCLVMIEAGAAGCDMLVTDVGALYETGAEFASFIPIRSNRDLLVKEYSKALGEKIDSYWSKENQNKLSIQSGYYNNYYSWDKRSKEWDILFNNLSSGNKKIHPGF
jgi:glycosyltransferase involved in cell wall biosynthesis